MDKLRSLNSADELDQAATDLQAEIAAAEARLEELRGKKEAAIFEGSDKDRKELRTQIRDAEEDLDDKRVALAGAERRRDEARQRERDDQVQARMKQAGQVKKQLEGEYARFHALAAEIAETAKAIAAGKRELGDANEYARTNGRPDLAIGSVLNDVAQVTGREVRDPTIDMKIYGYTHGHDPANSPLAVLKAK
jgi:chromosome segregation ATPase